MHLSKIESNSKDIAEFEKAQGAVQKALREISSVVVGQEEVVKLLLSSVLSGGHAMLVGVPGLAKTLLVETFATVAGLESKRVQFTPDLMPPDITGSEVLEQDANGKRTFRFIKGPIFCQLLMADEINRASPKTQAALLQAMQEGKVTIGGVDYDLPKPFHVVATRNPIEQEGTYPLPEAQLDRFIMEINIGYPSFEKEKEILLATTGNEKKKAHPVLSPEEIISMQKLIREMPIGQSLLDDIARVVRETRPETTTSHEVRDYVSWGAGPRAGQALVLAARAYAFISGRFSPLLDDVIKVSESVFQHRVITSYAAKAEGFGLPEILKTVFNKLG